MRQLVFIDDDEQELRDFRDIVGGHYDYTTVHWPGESAKLESGQAPNIFVSDLYLPPPSGDTTPTPAQRGATASRANQVAERFSALAERFAALSTDHLETRHDKARLKETMKAITAAYDLLGRQWRALGQSPENGVALLRRLKVRHPGVPVVFYSRKITPEDVVRVLRAGAVDAIRKDALERDEVLARLAAAQDILHKEDVQSTRAQGLNVNVTLIPAT
jgi:DNA-binding NarL/FixJ family response regulator